MTCRTLVGAPSRLFVGIVSCQERFCREPSAGTRGDKYLCAEHFDEAENFASQEASAVGGIDGMHTAMAGWPSRSKPIEHVCETCRYWSGRALWRRAAHFLTLGMWIAPEWGRCRSRLSQHKRTKTWALESCRRWRVVLRKGAAEPSDAETMTAMKAAREAGE